MELMFFLVLRLRVLRFFVLRLEPFLPPLESEVKELYEFERDTEDNRSIFSSSLIPSMCARFFYLM